MSNKVFNSGYVVMRNQFFGGPVIAYGVTEEGKEEVPEFFNSEEDALTEIDGPNDYPAAAAQFEDGRIIVYDKEGEVMIETTLEKWRKNR